MLMDYIVVYRSVGGVLGGWGLRWHVPCILHSEPDAAKGGLRTLEALADYA